MRFATLLLLVSQIALAQVSDIKSASSSNAKSGGGGDKRGGNGGALGYFFFDFLVNKHWHFATTGVAEARDQPVYRFVGCDRASSRTTFAVLSD